METFAAKITFIISRLLVFMVQPMMNSVNQGTAGITLENTFMV